MLLLLVVMVVVVVLLFPLSKSKSDDQRHLLKSLRRHINLVRSLDTENLLRFSLKPLLPCHDLILPLQDPLTTPLCLIYTLTTDLYYTIQNLKQRKKERDDD
ncbi:hypothetical protein PanWU01x14_226820 [Parasponia andersonii]|uniref:Uncharacterized protein n=1 Tax=Parasponia andersonii TaxID=3476 RepID=A0A2P5BML6_PARAD|nr:hypothetical protein PanWU01x14_226820 [Parasponia andersonii]